MFKRSNNHTKNNRRSKMTPFMITIQVFLWISLIGNMVLMYEWIKATNEVRSIKQHFIRDLFLIRNGYGK